MADQAADFAARQLSAPAPAAAVQQTAGEVGASQRTDQPAAAPAPELDAAAGQLNDTVTTEPVVTDQRPEVSPQDHSRPLVYCALRPRSALPHVA